MKKIILTLTVVLVALNISAQEPVIKLKTEKKVGDVLTLSIRVSKPEHENLVWIDLNGNGKKDAGEQVATFREKVDYRIQTQDISIYGPVWVLNCAKNEITQLDLSRNQKNLNHLYCGFNLLTELDVSKNSRLGLLSCVGNNIKQIQVGENSRLKMLNCYRNQIDSANMLKLINSLPILSSSKPGELIISSTHRSEKNEVTDSLISSAKSKGWEVIQMKGSKKNKL